MDKTPKYVKFWKLGDEDSKYKMRAEFYNSKKEHIISVKFGAKGYQDMTIHKNLARKNLYLLRHAKRENWEDPMTRGALSRWVLWHLPSLEESIADYRKRFNLSSMV